MRKYMIVILAAFLVFGFVAQVQAENSAQSMNGTVYTEQPVYVTAYNNSGAAITSNSIVVLDSTGTAGTTLGAYVTTTTTADNGLVFGVTDETIATATSGRVCVRGPHKVLLTTLPQFVAAGASLSTTTTAGKGNLPAINANGTLGNLLSTTASTAAGDVSLGLYWVWVRPSVN